jgi:hypothetical protein
LISWRPIGAALVVSALLIGALLLVVHPRHAAADSVAAVEPPVAADAPQPGVRDILPPELPPVMPVPVSIAAPSPPPAPVIAPPASPPPPLPPPIDTPPPRAVAAVTTVPPPAGPPVDHRYGTSVDFVDSPTEAAEQALKQKKLLFVLHISGNFEKDCFT